MIYCRILQARKLSVITDILLLTLLLQVRLIKSDAKSNSCGNNTSFDLSSKVDEVMKAIMKCHAVPGAAVAVVKGRDSWVKGYGVKDIDSLRPVTGNTPFMIASLTKAFTSALTAIAIDKGRSASNQKNITWHTPIKEILGDDVISFPNGLEDLSIHDVFTHHSGLSPMFLMIFATFPPTLSRPSFLKQFDQFGELPGYRGKYMYNNWAYGLGGDVIEKFLGISYGAALKRYLFRPLGMRSSELLYDDINTTSWKMARPYQNSVTGQLVEIHPSVFRFEQGKPSAMIVSSASDMTKWMRFMLNNGVTSFGRRLINEKLFKDMVTTQKPLNSTLSGEKNFVKGIGYGWFTGSYRGVKRYHHGGSWYGYKSRLALFPEQKVAVIVMLSGPGFVPAFKAYAPMFRVLCDVALDLSPTVNATSACPSEKFQRREQSVENTDLFDDGLGLSLNPRDRQGRDEAEVASLSNSSLPLINFNSSKYAGTFLHSLFGKVVISSDQNRSLSFNASEAFDAGGDPVGLLFHFHKLEGYLVSGVNETEFRVKHTGKLEFLFKEYHMTTRLKFGSLSQAEGRYNSLLVDSPKPGKGKMTFTRVQPK